jgi:hypothetical protein
VSYDTDSNAVNTSTNMDDTGTCANETLYQLRLLTIFTGFFSVQVLDKALEVWGLKYIPHHSHNISD